MLDFYLSFITPIAKYLIVLTRKRVPFEEIKAVSLTDFFRPGNFLGTISSEERRNTKSQFIIFT